MSQESGDQPPIGDALDQKMTGLNAEAKARVRQGLKQRRQQIDKV